MVAHRHDINLHIWFIDVALDLLKRYSDCVCFLRKSFIGTIYLLLEFIRYLYSYAFFDRGRALFGNLAAKAGSEVIVYTREIKASKQQNQKHKSRWWWLKLSAKAASSSVSASKTSTVAGSSGRLRPCLSRPVPPCANTLKKTRF
jgi:hypothetical protein